MATLSDVAAEAGVSSATVSRYLSGRGTITPETSARVEAALIKLNYEPNLLARQLATGRTNAISLVVPDIGNPFFAEVAAAVEREARAWGYSVYMASTSGVEGSNIAMVRRLAGSHVDGLIVMTNKPDDGGLVDLLKASDKVVLLDEDIPDLIAPRVWVNGEQGSYLATSHLIALGHSDIAFIGGPPERLSARDRAAGYRRAMAESGLAVPENWSPFGPWDRAFGVEAATAILGGRRQPTAIVASSDYQAIGVMQVARAYKLDVPNDLSVTGFDDMPFADMVDPALTTLRQPVPEMGRMAVESLMALIKHTPSAPQETRLPVELIIRSSTAVPRTQSNPA